MKRFILIAVLLAGCGDTPAPKIHIAEKPAMKPDVGLRVVRLPELEAYLDAQRGKVVLIDIWADS